MTKGNEQPVLAQNTPEGFPAPSLPRITTAGKATLYCAIRLKTVGSSVVCLRDHALISQEKQESHFSLVSTPKSADSDKYRRGLEGCQDSAALRMK